MKTKMFISFILFIFIASCTANIDYTEFEYEDTITKDDYVDGRMSPIGYLKYIRLPEYNVYSYWDYIITLPENCGDVYLGHTNFFYSSISYTQEDNINL